MERVPPRGSGAEREHAYVGHRLAIVLDPYARAAGLAGTDPFNLGEPEDYRVPDGGYHRGVPSGVWVATAAIVVEIVSPGDETYEKFDFYARHGVEELLIANPRSARWPSGDGHRMNGTNSRRQACFLVSARTI